MSTTIAVKESTLQLLTKIKEEINANSIDEAIVRILQKVEEVPTTRFGSQPRLKPFTEKERARFHEL